MMRLLKALQPEPAYVKVLILTPLFTASRKQNVRVMKWVSIDWATRKWTRGYTKNGWPQIPKLHPMLLDLINQLPRTNE